MTIEVLPSSLSQSAAQMELRGVRVHNLKDLDLDIPLDQLVVISGVSGSGKSSLAFETLFREGQRRYIESFSTTARRQLERIDRPDADRIAHVPVAIAVRNDRSRGRRPDARSTMASTAEVLDGVRLLFARVGRIICPSCGHEVRSHSSTDVINATAGLPEKTRVQVGFVIDRSGRDDSDSLWLARGFSRAIWDGTTHDLSAKPIWPKSCEVSIVVDRFVTGTTLPARIRESAEVAFREGAGRCWLLIEVRDASSTDTLDLDGRSWRRVQFSRRLECLNCQRRFMPLEPRLFNHFSSGACPTCRGTGRSQQTDSGHGSCLACGGSRLRDEARAVHMADLTFPELCRQTPSAVKAFVQNLAESLDHDSLDRTERIRADITSRMRALCEMGLDYLTLDRAADSLSGGEMRRLMLAAVIGSGLTGTLVVVDEPSAGLADDELPGVIAALRRVQSGRNSVIVVDHAPQVVSAADHVIELGPEAGPAGGSIVYQGSPARFKFGADKQPSDESPTGTKPATVAKNRRSTKAKEHVQPADCLRLSNVQHHNLHDFHVEFPMRQLCVVSGPSGSGKTSLITQVLFPAVCKQLGLPCSVSPVGGGDLSGASGLVDVVLIDQTPLTKSSRSNPATWLQVFDEIRQTFATTMDARQRGFTARHFSFNSPTGGRCRSCLGTGQLKHDMQFLPDVILTCPECGGTRYRKEILDVKYRSRSIADVLAMSVSESASFFRSQPRIQRRFQMVEQIGLDYLVLGQPSETLSGGEAQRLKLAAKLAEPSRVPCLIICDEPTIGLHSKDVARLVTCFRELIANGHSIVLADNSPELKRHADFLFEMPRIGDRPQN